MLRGLKPGSGSDLSVLAITHVGLTILWIRWMPWENPVRFPRLTVVWLDLWSVHLRYVEEQPNHWSGGGYGKISEELSLVLN